ncbi:prolipoprotein diacylglyceryl transferase [Patescibacteria group bacterium]|nr:prolipoprotein diacylglyceryl transferase [Patescibacteria group bacterium]MBU1016296.1 prolipoprotein diacylglyceryl transferase [Patescibacteria group bacterium]MBU1685572.1 prolipoprotein diacylglyceryl transferase [Patescibacteria group bacterium]MBU1938497.1 prolipoprotein diacylglyceryl transferase [Patescibacteria group bacterium]
MLEVLFQNSLITVRSLNILLALGFLFTGTFLLRYVNRHKMNTAFVTEYFPYVLLAALFGGRAAYVLSNISEFQNYWISLIYVWDLKFSFFGMLAGALLAVFLASRKNREDFWSWSDALFLSSMAMLIFVHVGYFFAGKEYGLPTNLPWGIALDVKHIPFVSPIHPTQLYAALLTMLLLIYSVKASKRIHLSGVVGTRALMIYSLGMFGIDFMHGSPSGYLKIAYGIVAALAFIGYIHCSHKTHIIT